MNPRFEAVKGIEKKDCLSVKCLNEISSEAFGKHTFNRSVMQKMLPRDVYRHVVRAMDGIEKIKAEYADTIAVAVKEWAMSHGATHYTHWFQPLTGAAAEKHDAFIDWNTPDKVIEKFDGKQLIQGEPDASSFPSGGLRSTYEARGYTGWDPTSPIFLWEGGDGITLCIPSIFFSWTGNVLDTKIPLLRSDSKINKAALRLMHLTGLSADYVYSTLGLEQEYFAIDRALRNLRPDLLLLGKTVFGAHPPKGQELQDHYFGSVKDRILSFMRDFEISAIRLGIPVKTRHNEVAPAQYEVAPVFEKASLAIDHNILLMELMRQIAVKHGLACLLHEKPFAGFNGSGKHANWSLSSNTGINLLDPSDTPENNLHFLILLVAIVHAVHKHSTLLRSAIGSASNDYRLGGHEAPPAIMSIYLGQGLEDLLENIEQKGNHLSSAASKYQWESLVIPDLSRDNTDRNRTSPFAFTGNKFEFRAVGSSSNPAFAVTALNLIVAESLNQILDEIETKIDSKQQGNTKEVLKSAMPVLQKYLKASKAIRFAGDNYSEEWVQEAKTRGLPNIKRSPAAFAVMTSPETIRVFEGVLTPQELASRQEIYLEHYALNINIEANLMVDMFKTSILPVVVDYQNHLAKTLVHLKELGLDKQQNRERQMLEELNCLIEGSLEALADLEEHRQKAASLPFAKGASVYSGSVMDKMEALREVVDRLEKIVDDRKWPLPKYRELLFMI